MKNDEAMGNTVRHAHEVKPGERAEAECRCWYSTVLGEQRESIYASHVKAATSPFSGWTDGTETEAGEARSTEDSTPCPLTLS